MSRNPSWITRALFKTSMLPHPREWAGWEPATIEEEVGRLQQLGYKVTGVSNGVTTLEKRKMPPISFLLYLPTFKNFGILIPALIVNWAVGYKFIARIYEHDGRVITE